MLVLGFEGYGGRGLNPSQEIAKAVDGRRIGGVGVRGRVLPVRYAGLAERVSDLVAQERPAGVLAVGLWPGEPVIRIERIAANVADFEIPDNAGEVAKGPLRPGGPDGRLSTLPVERMRDALLAAGIPARVSGTAGAYLCNAMLYSILDAAERLNPAPPAGFIHVPYMPKQVAELLTDLRDAQTLELHQRADLASMELATMVQAVEIAIEATLAA